MNNKITIALGFSLAANAGLIWFANRALQHIEVQKNNHKLYRELAIDLANKAYDSEADPDRRAELDEIFNETIIEHHARYMVEDVDFNDLLKGE